MSSLRIFGRVLVAVVCMASAIPASRLSAAEPEAAGQKMVPLQFVLPKPLFQGTPKNIKASATLEKYDERPRAAFYAPEGTTNLALHKKVTASDAAPVVGELSMVTDGDKDGADGSYVELAPGKQWIQIDLEKTADIYALLVWHYFGEGRVYHDIVIQVSDDPDFLTGVQTVFNNDFDNSAGLGIGKHLEYIDDSRGRLFDAKTAEGKPVRGRYVRLYSNGNTSNDLNHYIEVEVWGKPVAK